MKTTALIMTLLCLQAAPAFAEEIDSFEGQLPLQINEQEAASCDWNQTGCITISISNLRNSDGLLGVALFRTEHGFPEKSEKAFALTGIRLENERQEIILRDIPYGTYAVSVLHDENANMEMDKNWLGIPREGFGASNNPKISMGPPEFDESNFVLDASDISLIIDMKYF